MLWWLAYQRRHSYWVKSNLGFSNPSLFLKGLPNRHRVSCPLHRNSRLRHPEWLDLLTPRAEVCMCGLFFFFFRSFPGAQIPTQILFFHPTQLSGALSLLYRSSVSFQLAFCENCPTFWCLLGKLSYMSAYSNILIPSSFSFLIFHSIVKVLPKPGWDFEQYLEKPEGGTNF